MATVTVIEFSGRARRRNDEEEAKQHYPDDKSVDVLNDRAYFISERIRSELRRTLPLSVNVEVEIEFSVGTIEWVGVVYVLDWLARLSDNIGFVEYVVRFVRFIVNRVVRNEISGVVGPSGRMSFETEARAVTQPADTVVDGSMRNQSSLFRTLLILTAINTLALIALLILQIYIIRR